MHIVLNGDGCEVPGPLTIQQLLDHLGVDGRLVAVECNRVVVPRARYSETGVPDGAEIEIVAFVGGGAPQMTTVTR